MTGHDISVITEEVSHQLGDMDYLDKEAVVQAVAKKVIMLLAEELETGFHVESAVSELSHVSLEMYFYQVRRKAAAFIRGKEKEL